MQITLLAVVIRCPAQSYPQSILLAARVVLPLMSGSITDGRVEAAGTVDNAKAPHRPRVAGRR